MKGAASCQATSTVGKVSTGGCSDGEERSVFSRMCVSVVIAGIAGELAAPTVEAASVLYCDCRHTGTPGDFPD
jgi:hypothetical protein